MAKDAAAGRETGAATGAGYRRSAGSSRGEARRRELLERVTDDLAVHGLVDFSLRRAARAAGTTHKVLLYHFDGVDDLLRQSVLRLRERRIGNALAAIEAAPGGSLAERVRALWPMLRDERLGLRVLDQAIGLALYDPPRHRALARQASEQYLPLLTALCPPQWSQQRRAQVAEMILASLRGFLVEWITTGETAGADAGMEALARALEREEAATAP